jgi:predicted MPP superfamily phosphohydrolase
MRPIPSALKYFAASAFVAGVGTYLYASRVEARRYQLETVSVRVRNGNGNNGRVLKILHLSDMHLCFPETDKIDFLRSINSDSYDMVVLTGDVFENYSGLTYASSILPKQPKLGAYAVLGNHDYFNYTLLHKSFGRLFRRFRHPGNTRDVKPFIAALETAGFTVLRNETLDLAEQGIHITGIDYPYVAEPRMRELTEEGQSRDLRLLLFHLPIFLDKMAATGVHAAFGGHTHGGQIRLPGYGAIITDSELSRAEASGLFWRGDTAFHISRGLSADPRTNFRLFCPPAATIVEVFY